MPRPTRTWAAVRRDLKVSKRPFASHPLPQAAFKLASFLRVDAGPSLDSEVRMEFPQLGDGLCRLLVVAGAHVSGREVGKRPPIILVAGKRLVARLDRCVPLRQVCVEFAGKVLPCRRCRVSWTQRPRNKPVRQRRTVGLSNVQSFGA
jgi:hypothetical protein